MMTENAGEFSGWLSDFVKTMEGRISAEVPCGTCVACCTSSKFVHIRPSDRNTLKMIPKEIMFPAPGLPKGYYLLGYDENGHCPMFKGGKCTIYAFRPETCRQYDCRIYAATNVAPEGESPEIVKQAKSWQFRVSSPEDRGKMQAVQRATSFLSDFRDRFPDGYIPRSTARFAVLALRIHEAFNGVCGDSVEENPEDMIDAIVSKYRVEGDRMFLSGTAG